MTHGGHKRGLGECVRAERQRRLERVSSHNKQYPVLVGPAEARDTMYMHQNNIPVTEQLNISH